MGTFAVLLHEQEEESSARIRKRLVDAFAKSDYFEFSEHVYLVTGAPLTTDVADKLEITEDEQAFAAILSLNGSYSGRSWSKLWEFLRQADARR